MKPIRFADLDSEDVEERDVFDYREGRPTGTGQVPVSWTCPFCLGTVSTWLWSLSGGGKRCPGCKALTGRRLISFQWKSKVEAA